MRAARGWLEALDKILRGETTRPSVLREQSLRVPLGGLSLVVLGLALFYGFCMGMYPGCRLDDPGGPWGLRWLSCTLKIPALFLLTLAVTFPSLYVVNALVGSRLRLVAVLQLLVAALGVNLAVLASSGPIVAFFSFGTTNCPFMLLLNVLVFAVSGLLGMAFLLQTLHRLSTVPKTVFPKPRAITENERLGRVFGLGSEKLPSPSGRGAGGEGASFPSPDQPAASVLGERQTWREPILLPEEDEEDPCRLDPLEGHVLGRHVKTVFWCWTVIFAVVGAQIGLGLAALLRQSRRAVRLVRAPDVELLRRRVDGPSPPGAIVKPTLLPALSLIDDVLRRRPWTTQTAAPGRAGPRRLRGGLRLPLRGRDG